MCFSWLRSEGIYKFPRSPARQHHKLRKLESGAPFWVLAWTVNSIFARSLPQIPFPNLFKCRPVLIFFSFQPKTNFTHFRLVAWQQSNGLLHDFWKLTSGKKRVKIAARFDIYFHFSSKKQAIDMRTLWISWLACMWSINKNAFSIQLMVVRYFFVWYVFLLLPILPFFFFLFWCFRVVT